MIEKLKHYAIENPPATSIYDEEAMTALQLAGRTAGKMNETVQAFNELDEKTQAAIDSIPGVVSMDVEAHIQGGAFDKQISDYAGDLEGRLNNLLGSVKTGTTTMDAEVIDIRTGMGGERYSNAGTAVRSQLSRLKKEVSYGSVHTNGAPIVEFVEGDHVKLTLPGTTNIFFNGIRYGVDNLTATLSGISSYHLFSVFFNYADKTLSVATSFTEMPENCVMIGRIYRHGVYLYDHSHSRYEYYAEHNRNQVVKIWANEPATVDTSDNRVYTINVPLLHVYFGGNLFNIGAASLTYDTSGSTAIVRYLCYNANTEEYFITTHSAELTWDCWIVGIWSLRTGIILNNQGEWMRGHKTPASLILGRSGDCVEFNSVTRRVTFPNDTLVLTNMYPGYYIQLADSKDNSSISWENFASSALCVYLNSKTEQLEIHQYNEMVQPHLYLLCSFRTTGAVDIGVPYRWDGRLFNMDTAGGGAGEVYANINSVAHRGYSVEAPENTLAAYRAAKAAGFKYAECDVQFTSDNVPVLIHDATIDNTSNGSGTVANMTYNQLIGYDFGSWKGSEFTGEKIPRFEDFIHLCRDIGLHPYIELKTDMTASQIEKLVQIVRRHGMSGKVTWISFDISNLYHVLELGYDNRVGYICTPSRNAIDELAGLMDAMTHPFIVTSYGDVSTDMVDYASQYNLPWEVYTVNDASIGAALDPYVSGIISDSLHFGNLLREVNL